VAAWLPEAQWASLAEPCGDRLRSIKQAAVVTMSYEAGPHNAKVGCNALQA
jgi:hypothetical protein